MLVKRGNVVLLCDLYATPFLVVTLDETFWSIRQVFFITVEY